MKNYDTDRRFYIAACSKDANGGIHLCRLTQDGTPKKLAFYPLIECNWLTYSHDRKYLYATCSRNNEGGVAAWRVAEDGSLTYINELINGGQAGCYLSLSPNGKFLFCANYMSGDIAIMTIEEDGSLGRVIRRWFHHGHGPNKKRQESAHVHYVHPTPDNQYLLSIDLGINDLVMYPFDDTYGLDVEHPIHHHITPDDAGPRHVIFSKDGSFAYLINELGNSIQSFRYHDGTLDFISQISTLPQDFNGTTKASAIRLTNDERFLLGTNRGFDSIAMMKLDGNGGMTPLAITPSNGVSPRDADFIQDEQILVVTNEFSDNISFFYFDSSTGSLTFSGNTLTATRPLAVLEFIPK